MKRIFSLLFMLVGIVSVLAACGSSDEKSGAEGKDKLVIGIDDKFAPMGFRDDKNNIVGFDIDLATEAAKSIILKTILRKRTSTCYIKRF